MIKFKKEKKNEINKVIIIIILIKNNFQKTKEKNIHRWKWYLPNSNSKASLHLQKSYRIYVLILFYLFISLEYFNLLNLLAPIQYYPRKISFSHATQLEHNFPLTTLHEFLSLLGAKIIHELSPLYCGTDTSIFVLYCSNVNLSQRSDLRVKHW